MFNPNFMKLIKNLLVEDRASLLHNMYPEEIPRLFEFAVERAELILSDPKGLIMKSQDLMHSTNFWFDLVRNSKEKLDCSWNLMVADSNHFARNLFEGNNFLFSFYCLHHYIISGKCVNKPFIKATETLFFFQ